MKEKEDFLEAFDELLHNYLAEDGYEDVVEIREYNHVDGHKYSVTLSVIRK